MVRKRKLQWFDNVVRQGADSLAKTILEGMVDGKRSRRRRGIPENSWMDNIIEWPGMKVVDFDKIGSRQRGMEEYCWAKRSCAPTT